MIEELDPLTQNLWGKKIASLGYHLWLAGNPISICGVPWGPFWRLDTTPPGNAELCQQCMDAVRPT